MRNAFTRSYGAAICEWELKRGRQVSLTVNGPLTPAVIARYAKDLDRIGMGVLAKSITVNLESAAIAVTMDFLAQTPKLLSEPLRVLPIAFVVPPGSREIFREYAWMQAKFGLLRGVFLEQGPAQEWAVQKETPVLALRSRIRAPAR